MKAWGGGGVVFYTYNMNYRSFLVCIGILLCSGIGAHSAAAATTLESSSFAPEPNSDVRLTFRTTDVPTIGGTLRWYVDGREATDSVNQTMITVTTGDAGTPINVRAVFTGQNERVVEVERTFTPLRVDVLIHAESAVPRWYKGRALPSNNSRITANALVFGGTEGPYAYQWEVNGNRIQPTINNSSDTITFTPSFETELPVTVTVFNNQAIAVAQKTITVPLQEPEIYLYNDNPLRGLAANPLSESYTLTVPEFTATAVPFYFSLNNPAITTTWRLNKRSVITSNPYQITVAPQGGSGKALVDFSMVNNDNYLENAESSVVFSF